MSLPRTVHRIWLGGPEPDWLRPFAETWERPGWRVHQWTDESVGALFPLRNQDIYDRAEEIAPDHVGQLRADVLRYEILACFGGVYVDADLECVKALDDLLEGVECFVGWVTPRFLNNAVMGATPGHPFIEALIDGLSVSVEANRGRRPNRMTGPHHLTRTYHTNGGEVTTFPPEVFYPVDWTEPERSMEYSPTAYTRHHWANQRRERGIPSPA